MDEAAFLRAIHDDPDDDGVRLVFADWLDEQGDPERAEFVRLQVRTARTGLALPDLARYDDLLEANLPRWTAHLQPYDSKRLNVGFGRGLLETIHIEDGTPDDFDVLARAHGVRQLTLERCEITPACVQRMAALPHLDLLLMYESEFPAAHLAWLEELPPGAVIRVHFRLSNSDEWVAFQGRRAEQVARLDTAVRRAAASRFMRGVARLHHSRPEQPVRSLSFVHQDVCDEELRFLAWLPDIESVSILEGRSISEGRSITVRGLRWIAELPSLRELHLSGTRIDSLEPIRDCTTLEALEVWPVDGVRLGDDGTQGLDRLTNLRRLTLRGDQLADRTVERLGSLTQLRELDISLGHLQDENCLQALSRLRGLESLILSIAGGLSDENDGLRHLAKLTELRVLHLAGPTITNAGLRHLAALPKLRVVSASETAVTLAGARELAAQLPNASVAHRRGVVKSRREIWSFRRLLLGGVISLLVPTHWEHQRYSPDDGDSLSRTEDGGEHLGNPVRFKVWVGHQHDSTVSLDSTLSDILANDHARSATVKRNTLVGDTPESASCTFSNDFGVNFLVVRRSRNRVVAFQCEAPPNRFNEFHGLFLFVARSIRVGDEAGVGVGDTIEVSASEWR